MKTIDDFLNVDNVELRGLYLSIQTYFQYEKGVDILQFFNDLEYIRENYAKKPNECIQFINKSYLSRYASSSLFVYCAILITDRNSNFGLLLNELHLYQNAKVAAKFDTIYQGFKEKLNIDEGITINDDAMKNTRNSLIGVVKSQALSCHWKNQKGGAFKCYGSCLDNLHFRFKEADYPNCQKYFSNDPNTYPIVAIGFIAFYIYNWHRDKPAAEYYAEYYNGLLNEYKKQEAPSPSSIGRNLENEFFIKHEAEEQLKIQQSQKIFDYLTEEDKTTINSHIEAYLQYIKKSFNPVVDTNSEINIDNAKNRTRNLIVEKFSQMDKNNWTYAFSSEDDYNTFVELLTAFFENRPYNLPTTIIKLKRNCKTRLAKVLGEIHKELSENTLKSDTKYFEIIKILNHFEKETDLYKALTR